MKLFATVPQILTLAAPALAQSQFCYGQGNYGTVDRYQQTAAGICNGATYQQQTIIRPGLCDVFYEAGFVGSTSARNHCWNAFNSIIGGCTQKEGRNGGEWSLDGQKYWTQTNLNCHRRAKRFPGSKDDETIVKYNTTAEAVAAGFMTEDEAAELASAKF